MAQVSEGIVSVKNQRKLQRLHDKNLAEILSAEQLESYYRGLFDKEADAEGTDIANTLQKKYSLTDQNWKFIRIAFYKIGLETRVINKLMASQPTKAKKEIAKVREQYLRSIEEKGGIRVNPDMTVTTVRPFDPNTLNK